LIKQLYFDTDCISSFLWVKRENILLSLFSGKIILPGDVFVELSNPSIPHIKSKITQLKSNGDIITQQIMIGTEEYKLYDEMAISPPAGEKPIGKGEAAAIALAKANSGIVASNNLRDINNLTVHSFNLNFERELTQALAH
jgi:predicted nucleic acid-binding protein